MMYTFNFLHYSIYKKRKEPPWLGPTRWWAWPVPAGVVVANEPAYKLASWLARQHDEHLNKRMQDPGVGVSIQYYSISS